MNEKNADVLIRAVIEKTVDAKLDKGLAEHYKKQLEFWMHIAIALGIICLICILLLVNS